VTELSEPRFDWAHPVTGRPIPVAVATVAVLGLLGWRLGLDPALPAFLYFGVVAVLLTFIDIALKRLPDLLTLPSYGIGAALLALAFDGNRFVHALIGMAALFLLYAVQWLIVPNQLGMGDVKLSGVLGLYLGWVGLSGWMTGVLAGFLLGGLYSVGLLITRRATRKSSIPFGPFMLAGALLAILLYA
jgi:leader peptidase (prepilin peptidase)/N-methyltransferase